MSAKHSTEPAATIRQPAADESAWLDIVRRQVKSLHFGVVQIVVHDDRVVQIERTEKFRLTNQPGAAVESTI